MASSKKERRIPVAEVAKTFEAGIDGADASRLAGLQGLQKMRNAKANTLGREKQRLSRKLPADDRRLRTLDGKIAYNQGLVGDLDVEISRAAADVPDVDAASWVLYGFVRDSARNGLSDHTVTLHDEKGQLVGRTVYACTDANGYFVLKHTGLRTGAGQAQGFLRITDADNTLRYLGDEAFAVMGGTLIYREIVVGDEKVCTPPEDTDTGKPDIPDDVWMVEGYVRRKEQGVSGLLVSLYDKDLLFDDVLGTTTTGEGGYFRMLYRTEAFRKLFERKPDLYLKILDQNGETLFTSKREIRSQAGRREVFNIDLD